jgi:hypothetical protein
VQQRWKKAEDQVLVPLETEQPLEAYINKQAMHHRRAIETASKQSSAATSRHDHSKDRLPASSSEEQSSSALTGSSKQTNHLRKLYFLSQQHVDELPDDERVRRIEQFIVARKLAEAPVKAGSSRGGTSVERSFLTLSQSESSLGSGGQADSRKSGLVSRTLDSIGNQLAGPVLLLMQSTSASETEYCMEDDDEAKMEETKQESVQLIILPPALTKQEANEADPPAAATKKSVSFGTIIHNIVTCNTPDIINCGGGLWQFNDDSASMEPQIPNHKNHVIFQSASTKECLAALPAAHKVNLDDNGNAIQHCLTFSCVDGEYKKDKPSFLRRTRSDPHNGGKSEKALFEDDEDEDSIQKRIRKFDEEGAKPSEMLVPVHNHEDDDLDSSTISTHMSFAQIEKANSKANVLHEVPTINE